jgi:hypothetical protein
MFPSDEREPPLPPLDLRATDVPVLFAALLPPLLLAPRAFAFFAIS